MLDPQDRRLLREALRPPQGYALDRAIVTTFSLDLLALLAVPVSFTFFQLKDHAGPPAADPLALMEALRRYAKRVTVFCQAGQIHVPKRTQLLLGYLENSVFEVTAPRGGVFHPKLTILRYVANGTDVQDVLDESVVYRVLCSSRNLTFDRSWDTLLTLEGPLAQRRKNAFSRNHPLARFVRTLPDLVVNAPNAGSLADLQSIADELLRVEFEIPEGFDEMMFCPIGIDGGSNWPVVGYARSLAVAPFVSDGFVKWLIDDGGDHQLVSRIETLDELSEAALGLLSASWFMNTAADASEAATEDTEDAAEAPVSPLADGSGNGGSAGNGSLELVAAHQLRGLHAKLFVADDGWNAHVWTGSANATEAAFDRNVEFLVRLTGKKSKCGIAALLKTANEDGERSARDRAVSFADLLLRYERTAAPKIDAARKALERLLDEARYGIATSGIHGQVEQLPEVEGTARYRLRLARGADEQLVLPSAVTAECYPVTLRPVDATPLPSPLHGTIATFEPLSFEAITAFFAFRLTARCADAELSCAFVLNLPLAGAPADRDGRILLSLLRNREQLLRYLLMLLADDEEAAARAMEVLNADRGNHHRDGREGGFGLPLLEPLLQTLDRQPARLDQIARLIEDLRQTPEGRDLVTDDFTRIWQPIWEARGRLRHG